MDQGAVDLDEVGLEEKLHIRAFGWVGVRNTLFCVAVKSVK
jgi:hypothetical protein